MQRPTAYQRNSNLGGASPAETEILALGLCNDRLSKAHDARTRIEALAKNHQLWSALVRDLSSVTNLLPANLKDNLLQLGLWSMAYSNMAITKDIPLQPLIEVNRNISDGLRMQRSQSVAERRPMTRAALSV